MLRGKFAELGKDLVIKSVWHDSLSFLSKAPDDCYLAPWNSIYYSAPPFHIVNFFFLVDIFVSGAYYMQYNKHAFVACLVVRISPWNRSPAIRGAPVLRALDFIRRYCDA